MMGRQCFIDQLFTIYGFTGNIMQAMAASRRIIQTPQVMTNSYLWFAYIVQNQGSLIVLGSMERRELGDISNGLGYLSAQRFLTTWSNALLQQNLNFELVQMQKFKLILTRKSESFGWANDLLGYKSIFQSFGHLGCNIYIQ